tara:strand:- start:4 stop:432 length:429 start_codon:yes stop_codon:yes gene_type:complete
MSMIFESYEEHVENKNGKVSKTSRMRRHNGKKGVEILTKNGLTKKKSFKVNSKSLPNMKKSIILPTTLLVGSPIHQVISKDSKTKSMKSKKFKSYTKLKKGKIKTNKLKRKLSKVRKTRRKISRNTRKMKKSKPLWKKLIGM